MSFFSSCFILGEANFMDLVIQSPIMQLRQVPPPYFTPLTLTVTISPPVMGRTFPGAGFLLYRRKGLTRGYGGSSQHGIWWNLALTIELSWGCLQQTSHTQACGSALTSTSPIHPTNNQRLLTIICTCYKVCVTILSFHIDFLTLFGLRHSSGLLLQSVLKYLFLVIWGEMPFLKGQCLREKTLNLFVDCAPSLKNLIDH